MRQQERWGWEVSLGAQIQVNSVTRYGGWGALGNLDMALPPRVQWGHSDCEAFLSLAYPTRKGGLLLRLFLQHV